MRKAAAVGILGLALLTGATGCAAPGLVCPAIGWINTLEVDASAFAGDVFVQLCVEAGCSSAPGETPSMSSDLAIPVSTGDGVYEIGMTTPDEATVRVYDAAGALIQESEHVINWTLPTDPCGGPGTADPIILTSDAVQ